MGIESSPPHDDEHPESAAHEVTPEARAEFAAAQRIGTFHAFERGRALGIPTDELEAYVRGAVAEHVAAGAHDVAARILRSTGIGTAEEIAALAAAVPVMVEAQESLPDDVELAAGATFAELRDALAHREGFAEALRDELGKFMRPEDAAVFLGHLDAGSNDRVMDAFAAAGFSRDEVAEYFFIRFEPSP